MVQVIDYQVVEKENGEDFLMLVLEGGVEAVKSETTGKMYFTKRTVRVPATFDEDTCKSVVGSHFEGRIIRVQTDAYEFTSKETGEVMQLTHRFEYVSETDAVLKEQLIESELVH